MIKKILTAITLTLIMVSAQADSKLQKISVNDDFFRIGGDSILSIQFCSRLRHHDIYCNVRDVFQHRTIKKLAKYLETQNNQIIIRGEQGNLFGEFNLLPVSLLAKL